MQLEILTHARKIFEGAVTSVSLPGREGYFEILTQHAPLVSPLKEGVLHYLKEGKKESLAIKGGLVEVQEGRVIVLLEE